MDDADGGPSANDEAMRRMSKIVNGLLARGDSAPFREPVDWRGLELFDYPKIIKKAMDLGTVKRKLERGVYASPSECAEDVRRIWTNCRTYNADGSDFFLLAEAFSRRFEERYKKAFAGLFDDAAAGAARPRSASAGPGKDGAGAAPTTDAKRRFGSGVYRLSGLELGHVLQVLDMRCPQALAILDAENSEVEIDVDAIDPRTFHEIDSYVKNKVSLRKGADKDVAAAPAALEEIKNDGGIETLSSEPLEKDVMGTSTNKKVSGKKGGGKRKR